jgi:hypothetical protein
MFFSAHVLIITIEERVRIRKMSNKLEIENFKQLLLGVDMTKTQIYKLISIIDKELDYRER